MEDISEKISILLDGKEGNSWKDSYGNKNDYVKSGDYYVQKQDIQVDFNAYIYEDYLSFSRGCWFRKR